MNSFAASLQDHNKLDVFFRKILAPHLFFVAKDQELVIHPLREETIPWEIFRGQLLDSRQTRATKTFQSLHATIRDSVQGEHLLLTLRLESSANPADAYPAMIHVTRWLHCRVWEAVEENGAINSREVDRWIEELVGSGKLDLQSTEDELVHELRLLAFHAFVGLSRLPLNSVEAPLPLFSLGRAGFFPFLGENHRPANEPLTLLDFDPVPGIEVSPEHVRRFELFLRNADTRTLQAGADHVARLGYTDSSILLRRVFNETSLTPYTQFVDNALDFANHLFKRSALSLNHHAALLLGLVRQTVFHLTAYDLITFHHQGANYPDALLLDALMRNVLSLAASNPEAFDSSDGNDRTSLAAIQGRRRALLLGWGMHRFLEGLSVPNAPTSPGENRRLLPAPHQAVPEEQLNQPGSRSHRLFVERPIDWPAHTTLLQTCLKEIAEPDMLLDLGTGLFLDRPFGSSKPPASLDLTPLLSYLLFSHKLAMSRLDQIARLEPWLESVPAWAAARSCWPDSAIAGVTVPMPRTSARTVKLQDCWRTSDDFVVRGATNQTVRQLKAIFDWQSSPTPLRDWYERRLVPVPMPGDDSAASRIVFFDANWKIHGECTVADELGFRRRGALELPWPGLAIEHEGVRYAIAARFPPVPLERVQK